MKALNDEGQKIIQASKLQLNEAMRKLLPLVSEAKDALLCGEIERAKSPVIEAYQLTFQATHLLFIATDGLVAKVYNEEVDAKNHQIFSDASESLYNLYCKFWRMPDSLNMQAACGVLDEVMHNIQQRNI